MAEFTESPVVVEDEEHNLKGKQVKAISLQGPLSWKLHVNGAENQRGFGMGLVIVSPNRVTIEKSLRLGFSATNNKAKYEALLLAITMVQKMGGKVVEVFFDLRLIVGQVKGELETRDLRMQGYLNQARRFCSQVLSFSLYNKSQEAGIHMLILWQLWQPLLVKTYLGLYLLRIYISPPRRRRRRSKFTRLRLNLVEWTHWFYFSRKVFCLMRREKRTR